MIIAGNWKMNPDQQAAEALLEALSDYTPASDSNCEIVCFPPACYFSMANQALAKTDVRWGAQNCHQESGGAYTGEISAQMIKEQGGAWVILGHSERRQYFAETDALVGQKIVTALQTGLRPILCAIWIHTHEDKITTNTSSRSAATGGRQQTAETMMEKWNMIREILTHQRDTVMLLYSGNHYTAVIIEDTQDRSEKRLGMTEPQQEDPPTQRERPAKVRRRKRKRKDNNEASLASADCENQD